MSAFDAAALAEALTDGFVALDSKWRVTYLNAAAERLLEKSREELCGRIFTDEFNGPLQTRLTEACRAVLDGASEKSVEFERPGRALLRFRLRPLPVPCLGLFIQDLTEGRELGETSRISAERFRVALRHSMISVFNQDTNLRYTWVFNENPLYSPEILIGRTDLELNPCEAVEELTRVKKEILITGQGVRREFTVPVAGRQTTYQMILEPLRDSAGEIIGITGAAVNVTEHKDADRSLEQLNERLQTIIQASPLPIVTFSTEGDITLWNPAAERLFGWSAAEVLGQPLPFIPPEKREEHKSLRQRDLAGNFLRNMEVTRLRKDGSPVEISVSTAPLRDVQGKITGIMSLYADITERKRAERALRAREQEFSALLAALPDVIARFDRSLRLVYVSPAIQRFSGEAPARLTGKTLLEAGFSEEASGKVAASVERCFQTGDADSIEFSFISPVEGVRYMSETAIPERDELGDVYSVLSIIRDTTERQQAIEVIRNREEHFRTLAEALPQLVWTCLPDGSCDYLSRQWVAYTGIAEEDQLGLRWLDLVMHPDDRQRTFGAWMAAVRDSAPYDLEYRLRRHDDVYRWFRTRATPVRDGQGRITKWFGTCTDVDEQKCAAEERELLLAREKTARRIAELLNSVGPLLAAELDSKKLAQKVTDVATQLTGAEFGAFFHSVADEDGGSYMLYTLSGVAPETFSGSPMPRDTEALAPVFRGEGVVRCADLTKDPRYGHRSSWFGMQERDVPVRSYLAAPVMSRSGEVFGGLFFGHSDVDIFSEHDENIAAGIAAQAAIALDNARLFGEIRRAEYALIRSNDELSRANQDLNQFAYSASHDLREPLRMVSMYTELLRRRYSAKLDAQADQYIEFAVQGARRMELLLKDLLSYTQAANITEEAVPPGSVESAMAQVLESLRPMLDENRASVEVGSLPAVRVRDVHLIQLFQNLLENALKYRKADEPPRIQISAEREPDAWRFSVKDNGIGIPAQYSEQIFGIFRRLHPADKYPGTGIGLAICQRIVERYGGRIWVESEEGKGADFQFTLPG